MTFELTTNNAHITIPTFKNAALAESAAYMARIINGTYENMRRSSEALAIALHEVDSEKLYEDDGYKSTADFAEKVLGLKKSSVSTLISTAKRFSKGGEMATPKGLEGQTAYNLYYLKDATDEQIAAAVESGELSRSSSQKDIKAWADAHVVKDADKATTKPVNMYRVMLRNGATVKTIDEEIPEDFIEHEVKRFYPGNTHESKELSPVKCDDGTSIKRRVYIIDDGRDCPYSVVACYKLVKIPKASKTSAKTVSFKDMTDDELLAELERRRAAKAAPADTSAKAVAKVKAAAKAADR